MTELHSGETPRRGCCATPVIQMKTKKLKRSKQMGKYYFHGPYGLFTHAWQKKWATMRCCWASDKKYKKKKEKPNQI